MATSFDLSLATAACLLSLYYLARRLSVLSGRLVHYNSGAWLVDCFQLSNYNTLYIYILICSFVALWVTFSSRFLLSFTVTTGIYANADWRLIVFYFLLTLLWRFAQALTWVENANVATLCCCVGLALQLAFGITFFAFGLQLFLAFFSALDRFAEVIWIILEITVLSTKLFSPGFEEC